MRTFLVASLILLTTSAKAQRECASVHYNDIQKLRDPLLSARIKQIENGMNQQASVAARDNGEGVTVIKIPVVVHVLYKTASQNISEAQIKSQIEALNRDFRKTNPDTANIPIQFKSLAADIQIEFALATADPTGKATSGIIRKKSNITSWSLDDNIKFSAKGGDDAWDSRNYLNIWVGNLFGLLGFSSAPGGQSDRDGLVIHYNSFGMVNSAAPFEMGRTVVHEVGHWLGLKHIWGDTYCGDDLVMDTPKQGNFTSGCPNSFRSSCNNGTMGDMYMNYMDYTNDACMNMFTKGQKFRMRSLFEIGGARNSFIFSKGLQAAWMADSPEQIPSGNSFVFNFYPNPVTGNLVVHFNDPSWIGKKLIVRNMNGSMLLTINITGDGQKINFMSLPSGLYFMEGSNGTKRIREKIIHL